MTVHFPFENMTRGILSGIPQICIHILVFVFVMYIFKDKLKINTFTPLK